MDGLFGAYYPGSAAGGDVIPSIATADPPGSPRVKGGANCLDGLYQCDRQKVDGKGERTPRERRSEPPRARPGMKQSPSSY